MESDQLTAMLIMSTQEEELHQAILSSLSESRAILISDLPSVLKVRHLPFLSLPALAQVSLHYTFQRSGVRGIHSHQCLEACESLVESQGGVYLGELDGTNDSILPLSQHHRTFVALASLPPSSPVVSVCGSRIAPPAMLLMPLPTRRLSH